MYTIILITHIVMMVSSLVLMSGAIGMALFGKKSAAHVATAGQAVTSVGAIAGVLLLVGAPLSFQCAALTAYLILTTTLYIFGFGAGDIRHARLFRSVSP